MPKLKFLRSTYLLDHQKVVHTNDEVDIDDKKLAKSLVEDGFAEEITSKTGKKSSKKSSKNEEQVENDDE